MKLKISVMVALTILPLIATAETIQHGLPGCQSANDLDALISAALLKNQEIVNYFVKTVKCKAMPVGESVTFVGLAGFGTAEILHRGIRYFTPLETINKRSY